MSQPDSSSVSRPPARRRWRTPALRTWIVGTAILVVAVLLGLAVYEWWTWPDVAALESSNPPTTAFIEAYRHRAEQRGLPAPDWRWAPYSEISDRLKQAVLVSEDIEFFDHDGFSSHEIKKALRDTMEDGKPLRGASTLTQQLAKNLWLSPSRKPWRKVREALLTRALERHLSKRRILEIYLNVVELGPGVYGAEAAARRYFGTSASSVSRDQAAALAAALPKPSAWHPGSDSRTARQRTQRILGRMERARWLLELL